MAGEFVPKQELVDLEERMAKLLDQIGDRSQCRGCGADIWWVLTKNKKPNGEHKKFPVSQAFISHFADCPASDRFRKKR